VICSGSGEVLEEDGIQGDKLAVGRLKALCESTRYGIHLVISQN